MATTLYPGIPFSPQATLTDNIGAADTIIPVSDVSMFPAAPNLATIGTDEDGETILYAAKTANALSGCQRGVEGTAKAWQMGEIIARNFTAKDHNDLIAKVQDAAKTAEAGGVVFADGDTFQEKYDSGDLDGDPGTPGKDGKSAYQYAQDGGYTGTEEQFKALMGTGPWLPLEDGVRMLSAMIPKGRMRGDVDGDGKITQADVDLISKYLVDISIVFDNIQEWCADVSKNGDIGANDATLIRNFLAGTGSFQFADYYGAWTYDSTANLWTVDIALPDLTAGLSAVVVIDGEWENRMFSGAEVLDGILRISSSAPPITDVACKIIFAGANGAASTIFKTVASAEISGFLTAKVYNSILSANGWDAAQKTQTISIVGFSYNENAQIIQAFPYGSQGQGAATYKNSGIDIYNWADGSVTFLAETIPTSSVNIRIVVTDV